eukprot:TRINITY_DN4858_c0_g1_i1.p1 TRINITY_DN4858_c0_g1~~TRINITY_DN4858_c0_g1_i1.p1  ORF type:complete len:529 (-),score=76.78 TRINITY_DN4858_c0_g1_i1:58-1644(-)
MTSTQSSPDYIIVGSGSAGCVVAKRLSEKPNLSILVLEAGPASVTDPILTEPMKYGRAFRSNYDWKYFTEEQEQALNRRILWPRGKVLGGTSAINGMAWVRGNYKNYDDWAALGNEGWDSKSLLPYFKRSEDNQRGASKYHGIGGPISVVDIPKEKLSPAGSAFMRAVIDAGIQINEDINGEVQDGATILQVNQYPDFHRCSSATAYLFGIKAQPPNIDIWSDCQATRILFDETKKAVSVEFVRNGKPGTVSCKKEIIICGGAVNSPQILMLSGIGPRKHLESLGIECLVDLPVGENLQDHIWAPVAHESRVPFKHLEYANHVECCLFTTTRLAKPGVPDLQIMQCNILSGDELLQEKPNQTGFLFVPVVLYPKSRGTITLRSKDPLDFPLIQPNYLSNVEDLEVLINGIELSRKILSSTAFDQIRGREIFPGEGVQPGDSASLIKYIRNHVDTLYHPVGTCKMGPSSDSSAVVDTRLRVKGVSGLRVADASIMPVIVGGNTHAPVVMIGEKAADIIIADLLRTMASL